MVADPQSAGEFDRSELERLIDAADAVSFDFFDTLFVRPLLDPEDAFDIIAHRHGMHDFRQRRQAAQAAAFRNMLAAGRREITLKDIYACFDGDASAVTALMRMEYELELELIEPNQELFPLFQRLVADGKHVVITSDMYFSADFFIAALRPYGLEQIGLYISADCNATKRDSGELFEHLVRDLGLPPARILHIGDNLLADVTRPQEKGLASFHYRATRLPPKKKGASLGLSLSHGLLRTCGEEINGGSYEELGFLYGGPATVGFLQWIEERARLDRIDHLLFLSRDGYILERVARQSQAHKFPRFDYFLGSRIAYSLAAIDDRNFEHFLPFLLSGSEGLAPCELLERIGVPAPAPNVMCDLGLSAETPITPDLRGRVAEFLYAYRWQILQVCQSNRRALFNYLRQIGLENGRRVALVDVGWSGTTQEAFEQAVRPLMNLETVGYYFCLADTPERARRDQTQKMSALISSASTSAETVACMYTNRVAVELFFSAPHHSIIGLQPGNPVYALEDAGRGAKDDLQGISNAICQGMQCFAEFYYPLKERLGLRNTPQQIAWPMIELASTKSWSSMPLIQRLRNIDAWGSSRHRTLTINDYLDV
ncbi:haloacid dehalogenase [Brucella anthropi]|uniref:Haloacid dehalogenase n=1 Tax=Brucella anthropi TaxID=529 RepID=A0A6L3YYI1_BRUAN|nr:haloacid dehalogenase [Brucella anthropi]KAB2725361.1 haloacid dehalogenase [Brucella anthropi]KAB2757554.1 haloacid dehalogenase [Brucella anthropi]